MLIIGENGDNKIYFDIDCWGWGLWLQWWKWFWPNESVVLSLIDYQGWGYDDYTDDDYSDENDFNPTRALYSADDDDDDDNDEDDY